MVARWAHNPKVTGSSPVSATKNPLSVNKSDTYGVFSLSDRDSIGAAFFDDDSPEGGTSPKKKMPNFQAITHIRVKAYTPAQLTQGKDWYVSFYAFDPSLGEMKRKRIKINRIKQKKSRKEYANDLIARINAELMGGWNPWINNTSENSYTTFEDAADAYRLRIARLCKDDHIRLKTHQGNSSMLKTLLDYNSSLLKPKQYIYQMSAEFCSSFIDYIWLDKGNSGTTRDNYIIWLKSFAKFLLGKQYIDTDPTFPLTLLGKKKGRKMRSIIKAEDMTKLKEFSSTHNKHFLLASYILYYCFIRPKEMSYIQLEHISIKRGTIFIPDKTSKNRKDGTVTLPDQVIKLMIELNIFNAPSNFFLFGKDMKPNQERHSDKQFRDFWSNHIRPALKFPVNYKFYSLKDTGITDLIRGGKDLLSVRDQARHHSLIMTDLYTPRDIEDANEILRHHSSGF